MNTHKPADWVPSNHVKVGMLRKCGRYVITTEDPTTVTSSAQFSVLISPNVLETSTTGFGAQGGSGHQSATPTTGNARTLWTKQTLESVKLLLFHHGEFRAQNGVSLSGNTLVVGTLGEDKITFRTSPDPEKGLTSDAPVRMSVELAQSDEAHP